MKRVVIIMTILLLLLGFSTSVMGWGWGKPKQSPTAKLFQDANKAAFMDGDKEKGLQLFLQLKDALAKEGLKLSELSVCSSITMIYHQQKNFGQAFEWAQKGMALLAEVEQTGIENLDDNAFGDKLNQSGMLKKMQAQNRKMMLSAAKNNFLAIQNAYYHAVGDSAKAEEMTKKSKAAFDGQMKETYQIQDNQISDSYAKLAEQSPDQAAAFQKQAHKQKQQLIDDRKLKEQAQALHSAIFNTYYTNGMDGKADSLNKKIDEYIDTALANQEYFNMFAKYKQIMQNAGSTGEAEDFAILDACYHQRVLYPWSKAKRASLYFELGRLDEAGVLVAEAIRTVETADKKLPRIKTYTARSMVKQMKVEWLDKPPLAWQVLLAEILSAQKQPRAPALWEKIKAELNRPETKASVYKLTDQWQRENFKEKTNLNLVRCYKDQGQPAKARACMHDILNSRESIRATFSDEAHKRGYFSGNKSLYEANLRYTEDDPGMNFIAMERAKSRAMVDLMAQKATQVDEPIVQKLVAQRQENIDEAIRTAGSKPNTSGSTKRGIKISVKEIETEMTHLKRKRPELLSLVAVDVSDIEKLEKLLPQHTLALSYYVMDDGLYINALAKNLQVLKKIDLTRIGLFDAIYRWRVQIQDQDVPALAAESAQISLEHQMTDGIETITITNPLPFPMEIISISVKGEYYSHMMQLTPAISNKNQSFHALTPYRQTLAPGATETVLRRDHTTSLNNTAVEEIIIETNVGNLHVKGVIINPKPTTTVTKPNPKLIHLAQSVPLYQPLQQSLYKVLIAPIEEVLQAQKIQHLVIVPHQALHFVPFEALQDQTGTYLIEKYSVSYVPSLNVLQYCKKRKPGHQAALVAYGDPLGDLTFARKEVQQIKAFFKTADVFVGDQVTQPTVIETMTRGDIIHFACHGMFDPSSPFDSALVLKGPNGKEPLTVAEIMSLKCRPSLVTLSACDTGMARISGGDELIGLVRSFFVAGSPALLTTLWPIDDQSTSMLISRFYENYIQKKMSKADALKDAKLYLIQQGYKNPYYWSAFILQGAWT